MTTVNLLGPVTPPNLLGVEVLSPAIANDAALLSWTVPDDERLTLDQNGRVSRVAPFAGGFGLIRHAESLGPVPELQSGMRGLRFTTNANNYLHSGQTFDSRNWAAAVVAWGNGTDISNTRDVFAVYGGNRAYRVARTQGRWGVYEGGNTAVLIPTDVDIPTSATSNFRLIIMEMINGTLRFRERSRTTTGTIRSLANQTPETVIGAAAALVLGSDELPQLGGVPATSRSWGHGIHDAILFNASILNVPARLARLDAYFARAYGLQ